MKEKLDFHDKAVVNIFDEASLWAAPFGRLLLENIPMKAQSTVLDVGFGLGFPLIELSQRFGPDSQIYGIDMWEEGILRAKEKIRVLGIQNIEIFVQDAQTIPLQDEQVDLVCSNLGLNNFAAKEKVLQEVHRVLKTGGHLCIATNPVGTFAELFDLFGATLQELKWTDQYDKWQDYLDHRGTEEQIISELSETGLQLKEIVRDTTNMRFVHPAAFFEHGLIRVGFLESLEQFATPENRSMFFEKVTQKIAQVIKAKGEFKVSIPMLYVAMQKV